MNYKSIKLPATLNYLIKSALPVADPGFPVRGADPLGWGGGR